MAGRSEPSESQAPREADSSVLESLIDITRQRKQLDEYRTRARGLSHQVEPAVYGRVIEDYDRRDAALDEQAQPLKSQARKEFDKLRAAYDRVNRREESARLAKQELEFRHAVGEIDEVALAARVKEPESVLAECRSEVTGLDRQKARFLQAFDEEELGRPSVETPLDPRPTVPHVAAAAGAQVAPTPGDSPPVTQQGATGDADLSADATAFAAPGQGDPFDRPPTGVAHAAPEGEQEEEVDQEEEDGERTIVLPEGLLVSADPDAEYRLAALNYIGRGSDNQIQIQRSGVSRRHALIVAERSTYRLKDLQSQNGTFVNGRQIDEQALADGDIIGLGDARLVFRMPGASASGAPSGV